MVSGTGEFDVYSRFIDFLEAQGWTIICASPPGGTDNRYRKCLLPRRDLSGTQKGPRDEVDLTAHDGTVVLLAECKTRLTESMRLLNPLGESDYAKLKRIASSFSSSQLSGLLQRAYGLKTPRSTSIELGLAVGLVDCSVPGDVSVFELREGDVRIWATGCLAQRWPKFKQ